MLDFVCVVCSLVKALFLRGLVFIGIWCLFFSPVLALSKDNGGRSMNDASGIEIKDAVLKAFGDKFREEHLFSNLNQTFNSIDVNRDGITQDEIEFAIVQTSVKERFSLIKKVLLHDLNGDGTTTRKEVEGYFNYTRGQKNSGSPNVTQNRAKRIRDKYVNRIMALDPNQDGVIRSSEYIQIKTTSDYNSFYDLGQRAHKIATVLLKYAPNEDGRLTQLEAIHLFSKAFKGYQSKKKITALNRLKTKFKTFSSKAPRQSLCEVKKPSPDAKLVVYGSYQGAIIPTVTVAGQDKTTNLSHVYIEPGREKLFLFMSSYVPIIWKFTGAVERIEHIVLSGPSFGQGKKLVAAGSMGLESSKVSFVNKRCFKYFYKTGGQKGAFVKSKVKSLFDKKPDYLFGNYNTYQLSLPSGSHKKARRNRLVEIGRKQIAEKIIQVANTEAALSQLVKDNGDQKAIRAMKRFFPGGVLILDYAKVVSNGKAETYEVLPSQAGIAQLLLEGRLKRTSKRDEFFIVEPIRYPPGMGGAHSVKFHLKKGVPEPIGDPVHSCVFSEEKGRNIDGVCRM